MTLAELKTAISEFYEKVQSYQDLMLRPRNRSTPRIERNEQQIAQMRSDLNAEHGRLGSVDNYDSQIG